MGSAVSSRNQDDVKEEAIENLQHAYVKLAPSSVEGIGVFALREIPQGVVVMRWDWQRYASIFIPSEELKRRVPREVFDQLRRIWHVDQRGHVATPLNFTATVSYINFLNHSEESFWILSRLMSTKAFRISSYVAATVRVLTSTPNLAFRYDGVYGIYSTSRAVAKGEELCISYDRDYYPGYTSGFQARESGQGEEAVQSQPRGTF